MNSIREVSNPWRKPMMIGYKSCDDNSRQTTTLPHRVLFHSLSKKKEEILVGFHDGSIWIVGSGCEIGGGEWTEERRDRSFRCRLQRSLGGRKVGRVYPARNRLLPGAPQFVKTTLRCRLQDGKFVRDKRNRRNASLLFSFSLFISFFFFSNSCLFVSPTPLNRRMRLEGFNWRLVSSGNFRVRRTR